MHTNDGRWRQSCFIFFGMLLLLLLRQWSFIHILHPHPSNRVLFSITLRSLGSSLRKLRIFERARASLVVRGRAFDLLFFVSKFLPSRVKVVRSAKGWLRDSISRPPRLFAEKLTNNHTKPVAWRIFLIHTICVLNLMQKLMVHYPAVVAWR